MASTSSPSLLFVNAWNTVATTPGVCRNPEYNAWVSRPLDYDGMIATFNPSHALTKRTTTITSSPVTSSTLTSTVAAVTVPSIPVRREFNKDGFHFGKIKAQEIVTRVYLPIDLPPSVDKLTWLASVPSPSDNPPCTSTAASIVTTSTPPSLENIPDEHYILINVSPLCEGHSLFIPSLFSYYPQVMNEIALYLGCRLSRLIQKDDFRLGFNSLGAFASVNHLHFHVFFTRTLFPLLNNAFPCENAVKGKVLGSSRTTKDRIQIYPIHWHVKGYVFTLQEEMQDDSSSSDSTLVTASSSSSSTDNYRILSTTVYTFIHALQNKDIAHHILISNHGSTIYVFPRLKQRPSFQGRAQIALGEVCGLGIVTDPTAFYTPDEIRRQQQQQVSSQNTTTSMDTAANGTNTVLPSSTTVEPDNTLREITGKDFVEELQAFSYSFEELDPIICQSLGF